MDALSKIKLKLGLGDESNELLGLLIEETKDAILCELNAEGNELPTCFCTLIENIVIDLWRNNNYGQAEEKQVVSSVTDHSQSVSFAVSAHNHNFKNASSVLRENTGYMAMVYRHRKVRW